MPATGRASVTGLRIGILAYPGCFASEVFGIPDVLTMAMRIAGETAFRYDVVIVSPRRRVLAAGGVPLTVSAAGGLDVLVVPGFELGPGIDLSGRLSSLAPEVALIRQHGDAGRALVSICVGAFLLAEAGLLAGRRATTAWLFADALARRCPGTDVQRQELVVTDTGVTTTAAFSAMYDFALDLIRTHSGATVARRTARVALLDDARSAQSPYVDNDLLTRAAAGFSGVVMRRLDQQLDQPYELQELAASLNVSTRTLLRRFAGETGQSPLGYLQSARVHRACHLLETTERTVASIARQVGYHDAGTFSALFMRLTGRRPRDYRAAFRRARPSQA